MANISNNPWFHQHMQGEMEFTDGEYTRRTAASLVRGEYEGAPEPEPCGSCGATAYFRATVGAMQCPSCHALCVGVWVHKEIGETRGTMSASISDQYRLEYRWV